MVSLIVVPGSGGKDSCYASHILKYKYGMNLTVTWPPICILNTVIKILIVGFKLGNFLIFLQKETKKQ